MQAIFKGNNQSSLHARSTMSSCLRQPAFLLVALAFGLSSSPVFAQNSPLCPADTTGGKILGCTSQDISIALVRVSDEVDPPGPCLVGDDVPLDLEVQFGTNASSQSRDVSTWFAMDQGNLLIPSAQGGAASCISKALTAPIPSDDGTIPDLVYNDDTEKPVDACGDVRGIKNQTFTDAFPPVNVMCDAAVGGAEVDAIVAWHEKNDNECFTDDAASYGGFNTSKCNLSTTFFDLDTYGKLTLLKAASVDDVQFSYSSTGTVLVEDLVSPVEGFTLLSNGPGLTLAAQTGQPVTISETLFDDWSLTDISCVNNDPRAAGVPVVFQREGNSLLITLTEGNLATIPDPGTEDYGQSDVTCTFTNSQGGSITVIKDTVPDGPQDFSYSGTYTPDGEFPPFDFGGGFTLDDDADSALSNTAVFDNLDPGTYTVTEAQVAGFDLTSISCNGTTTYTPSGSGTWQAGDTGVSFDIGPGVNMVCTFVNVQEGGIVVAKQADPDGSQQLFTFTGDAAGSIMDNETIQVMNLVPGQYSATEVLPAGWDLTSIVCDDNNSSGSVETATATFNVEPGELVTCTFLNVQRGNIIFQKVTEGGDGTFTLSLTGNESGNTIGIYDLSTSGGTGQVQLEQVLPSDEVSGETYAAGEQVPAGWELISTVCTGANDSVKDSAAIDLDPGETVTCVFTNYKDASITIRKESQGFSDRFCWDYSTPQGSGEFCMSTFEGGAETSWGPLTYSNGDFGSYSFVEQEVEGAEWILASASCSDGQDPADMDIGPGDDLVCTFVNVIPRAVPVNSAWALLLLVLMVIVTAWRFRASGLRKA
jgi:hypothetical protein